ncbi:MAG: ATP-binding protein [Deltaproteobacteria bacterium]|nr:MAG: ATP-binding protein [Deltaproteobacteria bacterium]RLC17608.1 MAG: ATP-binding protein [Deltaproteobacteria bacterium]
MEKYTERFFAAPTDSFFIFGPRGTGKSTWLKKTFPDAYLVDLLDDSTFRAHIAHPERIKQIVKANPRTRCYIIDEVQRAPALLDSIHSLIEEYKTHQFIMTGSSARKLRRGSVNLLAGRALLTHFHPFMAAELGTDFSLDTVLRNGLIPLVFSARSPDKTLATYIALYLKEEVKEEGLVRDIGAFARFLEAISFSHGSILNLSNIARECHVSRKIVENHLSIIEDLLLGYKLPVFAKRARRAMTAQPKFYLFDAGVYYHLRPRGPLDSSDEIGGMALEGLVLQHLKAWCDYSNDQVNCYFWRSRGGAEVDFILYGQHHFHALEVKNAKQIHPKSLRSLKTFQLDYPEASVILLYRGTEKLMVDGILCCPVDDFLLQLKPNHWLNGVNNVKIRT